MRSGCYGFEGTAKVCQCLGAAPHMEWSAPWRTGYFFCCVGPKLEAVTEVMSLGFGR